MKIVESKRNMMFYIAYICWYLSYFVGLLSIENFQYIKNTMLMISFAILVWQYISKISIKYVLNIKIFAWLLIFSCVGVYSLLYKDFFIIMLLMIALNVKDIEWKKIFHISIFILLCISIVVILMCLCGMIPNVTNTTDDGIRYGLGFYHSNVLPQIFEYIVLYSMISKNRISGKMLFLFIGIAAVINIFCNSRNGFYGVGIATIVYFIYHFMKKNISERFMSKINNSIRKVGCVFFPLMATISFILLHLYKNFLVLGEVLNELLSNRLYLGDLYYKFQPIKFIELMTSDEFRMISITLDNGYYYCVARYGIIFLLIMSFVLFYSVRFMTINNNYKGVLMICIALVSCFIDNGFFSCFMFPIYVLGFIQIHMISRQRLIK